MLTLEQSVELRPEDTIALRPPIPAAPERN
jgi:hypothetical protein